MADEPLSPVGGKAPLPMSSPKDSAKPIPPASPTNDQAPLGIGPGAAATLSDTTLEAAADDHKAIPGGPPGERTVWPRDRMRTVPNTGSSFGNTLGPQSATGGIPATTREHAMKNDFGTHHTVSPSHGIWPAVDRRSGAERRSKSDRRRATGGWQAPAFMEWAARRDKHGPQEWRLRPAGWHRRSGLDRRAGMNGALFNS